VEAAEDDDTTQFGPGGGLPWRQSSCERKSERGRRRRARRVGTGSGLLWLVTDWRKRGGVRRLGAPHNGEEDEGRPLVWHTEEVGADDRDAQAAEPGGAIGTTTRLGGFQTGKADGG
jgi:hypothetical protein